MTTGASPARLSKLRSLAAAGGGDGGAGGGGGGGWRPAVSRAKKASSLTLVGSDPLTRRCCRNACW